jgi:hypothetical protein
MLEACCTHVLQPLWVLKTAKLHIRMGFVSLPSSQCVLWHLAWSLLLLQLQMFADALLLAANVGTCRPHCMYTASSGVHAPVSVSI